ncbi:periplasmic heavy metal sensor, partial [Streptomyces galilaeus]|uniref:periplasmic heavy metal sensor n=2 Tax=Bacteria TaxID=2 RepID=UPI0038F7F253
FTKVGASEEQKARARDIVKASGEEMKKLHAGRADDRQQMLALLSADTIDRGQIEQQRAARHAQMDEASKVMTRTMADLAEVLTPAQR